MDQFYLRNVALYESLVAKYSPEANSTLKDQPTEALTSDLMVTARIRPLLKADLKAGFPSAVFPRSSGMGDVDIHDLYNHPKGRPLLKTQNYQVDRIYNQEANTEEIYHDLVSNLIPFARNGGIGTLFAYGQTGSGKTFTISHLQKLVAETLMNEDQTSPIFMSTIDLAGNSAFDLLNARKPVSLMEDAKGVTQWSGAIESPVKDHAEVLELIDRAASFRRSEPTLKNPESSRSHSICRLRIESQSPDEPDGLLYLVDLAGSEAARDVAVHGASRMKEAREINMSLSVLKDCIRGKVQATAALAAKKNGVKVKSAPKPHIPFRQSALTRVLKHVFDPAGERACKTAVIACINPSLADAAPSKNTLRYAEMLRVLVPATKSYSADGPATWSNAKLQAWIKENSSIPPAAVAPTDTGAEILRLTPLVFEYRCVRSAGVTEAQAKALRAKLWQLHLDAQGSGGKSTTGKEKNENSTMKENVRPVAST